MSGTKISALPSAANVHDNDVVPLVQDGTNYKVDVSVLTGNTNNNSLNNLAITFGNSNDASVTYSCAIGYGNTASGVYANAVGNENTASTGFSSAFGFNNTASGYGSQTFGLFNFAGNTDSMGFGRFNYAIGCNAIAIGRSNIAGNIYWDSPTYDIVSIGTPNQEFETDVVISDPDGVAYQALIDYVDDVNGGYIQIFSDELDNGAYGIYYASHSDGNTTIYVQSNLPSFNNPVGYVKIGSQIIWNSSYVPGAAMINSVNTGSGGSFVVQGDMTILQTYLNLGVTLYIRTSAENTKLYTINSVTLNSNLTSEYNGLLLTVDGLTTNLSEDSTTSTIVINGNLSTASGVVNFGHQLLFDFYNHDNALVPQSFPISGVNQESNYFLLSGNYLWLYSGYVISYLYVSGSAGNDGLYQLIPDQVQYTDGVTVLPVTTTIPNPFTDSSPGTLVGAPSIYAFSSGASLAVGNNNQVTSEYKSVSIGNDNTVSGSYSNVFGLWNTSSGYLSQIFGAKNTCSGIYSLALGVNNTSSGYISVAAGYSNTVAGNYALAVGLGNNCPDRGAIGIGFENTASGEYAISVGNQNSASGYYSVVIGGNNTGSSIKTIAIGNENHSTGENTISLGISNSTSEEDSVSLGLYNNNQTAFSTVVGVNNNTSSGVYNTACGYTNSINGEIGGTTLGFKNVSSGNISSAVGANNIALQPWSSAFGYGNLASNTAWSTELGIVDIQLGIGPDDGQTGIVVDGDQTPYFFSGDVYPQNQVLIQGSSGLSSDSLNNNGIYSCYLGIPASYDSDSNTTLILISGILSSSDVSGTIQGGITFQNTSAWVINAVDQGASNFIVSGNFLYNFQNCVRVFISDSTGNNGYYDVINVSYDSPDTLITVSQEIPSDIGDGHIAGNQVIQNGSGEIDPFGWGASAFGYRNQANNSQTSSFGHINLAIGYSSSAMGSLNRALVPYSTACGYSNTASNYGHDYINPEGSGTGASAVGYENNAWASFASAFGYRNTASAIYSSAIGNHNTASGDYGTTACGYNNTASGFRSSAFGCNNSVSSFYGTAFGFENTVSGEYSVAFGYHNQCANISSCTFGIYNIVQGEVPGVIAVGLYNNTSVGFDYESGYPQSPATPLSVGPYSVALGMINSSSGLFSMALGYANTAGGDYSVAIGSNAVARPGGVINFGGPVVVRASDNGYSNGQIFKYSGVTNVFMSDDIDLAATVSDITVDMPANCLFYIEEVGVIVDQIDSVSDQPTVRFGHDASYTSILAETQTTGLSASGKRQRYLVGSGLLDDGGYNNFTFGVTVAATATTLSGRAYWKGILVEVSFILPTVTCSPSAVYSDVSVVGDVTDEGSSAVTDYGIVWSYMNSTPTINGDDVNQISLGAGIGSFSHSFYAYDSIYIGTYATNSGGTGYSGYSSIFIEPCFIEGTLVSLADGSVKNIEDIDYEDQLLVWNFDEGKLDTAKPVWISKAFSREEYRLAKFSDGSELGIVPNPNVGHRIFNVNQNKFTYLATEDTPVGTETFTINRERVSLIDIEVITKEVKFYNVMTDEHINIFANGILTSAGFNNLYPIANMKFIKDKREMISREKVNISDELFNGLRLSEQTMNIRELNNKLEVMVRRQKTRNNI